MTLSHKQLLGLPVETASGTSLGKVLGFQIDPISQTIVSYEVGGGIVLTKTNYLIDRRQVVALSDEKMVVDDTAVKEEMEIKAGEELQEESVASTMIHQSSKVKPSIES